MFLLLVAVALAGGPAHDSKAKEKKQKPVETSAGYRTGDQLTVDWRTTPPTVTLWTTHEVTGTNFTTPLPITGAKPFKSEIWKYRLPREVMALYTELVVSAPTQTIYGLAATSATDCLYRGRVVKRDVAGYKDGLAIVNTITYEIDTADTLACKPKGQTALLKQ
jgi:hypothetical protein